MSLKPNLYEHLDYRAFLRNYYQFKKATTSSFSHRQFSRTAGFRSPNVLQLVMEGQRNLSQEAIYKFAKALKLNKTETIFFELLVHFGQAKTAEEKNRYYEQIRHSKSYHGVKALEDHQYTYFSNWYFVALRELVTLKGFREDPHWINRKLKTQFTREELKRAIELLIELKLLYRDSYNCLKQTIEQVTTTPEMSALAILNFHREMLKKASESIENTPMEHRDVSALTIAISKTEFELIKERLNQVRREIHAIASQSKNNEALYQLNIQWFNLSEVTWG